MKTQGNNRDSRQSYSRQSRPGRTFGFSSAVVYGFNSLCFSLLTTGFALSALAQPTGAERWEPAVQRFEEADKTTPPSPGGVLFLGSSSIRFWDLERFVPITRGVNRGFGGSQISDSVHFFERIAVPHTPRHLVFYAGDNDIAAGESASAVVEDFGELLAKAYAAFPEVTVYFVAVKPSLARWNLWPEMNDLNKRVMDRASKDPRLVFVDIVTPMLDASGKPREELFISDGLHLSDAGYLLWSRVLLEALPQRLEELVFEFDETELSSKHNHGSSVVETPTGDLLVSWFNGSGERQSDDVRILGARWYRATQNWSDAFVMADTPGLPDTNCVLFVDRRGSLRLFYPTIQDNHWESALMKMKVAPTSWGQGMASPDWRQHEVLHFKPGDDFAEVIERKTVAYFEAQGLPEERTAWPAQAGKWLDDNLERAGDKLLRRIGWFGRAHPVVLEDGRVLMGLYSDGFSFGSAAISDDDGQSWRLSEPIVGAGAVQPSFAERKDGTVVAFMRDNGPAPKRVMVSESTDRGETWSVVRDHEDLLESGAGLEVLVSRSGRWLVVHNDLEEGRSRLSVSISGDEGRTFDRSYVVEQGAGRYHYPSITQATDGSFHVTYSYHLDERKSIKHVWLTEGCMEAGSGCL